MVVFKEIMDFKVNLFKSFSWKILFIHLKIVKRRKTEIITLKSYLVVLPKSLRKCKRRSKGNFMLKPNSNKIILCGVG